MYTWTNKAEITAIHLGLEPRIEGTVANYGNSPVTGQTAKAWLIKGYIIDSRIKQIDNY